MEKAKLEAVLSESALLRGLAPEHLKALADLAQPVQFAAGELIFREGDPADRVFIITHGKVALEIYALERGPITVQTVGEGETLGWSWLIEPYRWHFGARAVGVTRAVVIDAHKLLELCDRDNRFGYQIVRRFAGLIAHRLEATRLQLLDLYGLHQ